MHGIIDWHSHILPGIDDGSHSVEMSLQMLLECKRQGVQYILATPHFYPDYDKPALFFQRREEAAALLKHEQRRNESINNIEIRLGCELAWYSNIGSMSIIEQFCIQGTNLLLVEMPFEQWEDRHIVEVEKIISRGIIPVIAHPERFLRYQKDKKYLKRLLGMPVVWQFNAESLLGSGFPARIKRAKVIKLMRKTRRMVLGSDMHNTKTRPQNLLKAREILTQILKQEDLKRIDEFEEKYFF